MSEQYFYLNLVDAATGQINGIVTTNSPNSVVATETMVNVPQNDLNGVNFETVHKTHYYKDGKLKKYPPTPSGPCSFDFDAMAWVVDTDLAWSLVRRDRDHILKGTDWMVTKAVETGEPMPTGWAEYRQALRDITNQSDPTSVIWPTEPT